jgi:hypothetical protein
MARSGGVFPDDLLVIAKRSFVAGCFGCLGVGTIAVVAFLTAFVVFPTQFVALIRLIPIPVIPQRAPVVTATAPVSQLPPIEIWISTDNHCTTPHVTQIKLPIQQSLFICVRNPEGVTVHFTIQITLPNGRVVPLGADLVTNPDGKPFSIGAWSEPPSTPGVYRIDALIGSTIVGSTVLTVLP